MLELKNLRDVSLAFYTRRKIHSVSFLCSLYKFKVEKKTVLNVKSNIIIIQGKKFELTDLFMFKGKRLRGKDLSKLIILTNFEKKNFLSFQL